jgi:hypothetical protein
LIAPISVKPGASVVGVSPELVLGLVVIAGVFRVHGIPLCLTAGTDGHHSANSLHYVGAAVDVRLPSRYTQDSKDDVILRDEVAVALGDEWDIVLEIDHLHIELDPPKKTPVIA